MNMLIAVFATDSHVIQITDVQAIIGLIVVVLGLGGTWGSLKTSVSHIKEGLTEIKDEIKGFRESIGNHTTEIVALQVHTKYGVSNSPTVPNAKGSKLLEESGFTKLYPKIKQRVFDLIKEDKARTLYDYEVSAFQALKKIKSDPIIDPLKDYSVNNPKVPLDDIFLVASWVIRDEFAIYIAKNSKK